MGVFRVFCLFGFCLLFIFSFLFFPPDSVWVECCAGREKGGLEVIDKNHSASGSYDNLRVFITEMMSAEKLLA